MSKSSSCSNLKSFHRDHQIAANTFQLLLPFLSIKTCHTQSQRGFFDNRRQFFRIECSKSFFRILPNNPGAIVIKLVMASIVHFAQVPMAGQDVSLFFRKCGQITFITLWTVINTYRQKNWFNYSKVVVSIYLCVRYFKSRTRWHNTSQNSPVLQAIIFDVVRCILVQTHSNADSLSNQSSSLPPLPHPPSSHRAAPAESSRRPRREWQKRSG